jgi:isopentenyl-diphosphate delta-isomerase
VKRAAIRKLHHELGIPPEQLSLSDFKFITRLHYKSEYDDEWGEHESMLNFSFLLFVFSILKLTSQNRIVTDSLCSVDYILFIQKDVTLSPSKNEVNDWRWFTREELKQFVSLAHENGIKLTPWFLLIFHNFLFKWWDSLDNLEPHVDIHTIHHFDN